MSHGKVDTECKNLWKSHRGLNFPSLINDKLQHAEYDENGNHYPFKTAFMANVEILGSRWEVWMQFCQMKG